MLNIYLSYHFSVFLFLSFLVTTIRGENKHCLVHGQVGYAHTLHVI